MTKFYIAKLRTLLCFPAKILCLFFGLLITISTNAQTVLTTPNSAINFIPSTTAGGSIVFAVRNTNSTPITIDNVANQLNTGVSGTMGLWYHTTLTGAPATIGAAGGWTQIASATVNTTANGLSPIFNNVNFTIPANTTYRFAITGPNSSPTYAGSYNTPNLYTHYSFGGLQVIGQDNPISPGYSGASLTPTTTPSGFTGTITFHPTSSAQANDASASAFVPPTTFCPGNNDVRVRVVNKGTAVLNTVQVNWEVDGVLQTPVSYTTPIPVFTTVGSNEAIVTLGNLNFGTKAKTIRAWTSLPNGVADGSPVDDEVQASIRARLSGSYTLGSGADFESFSDLTAALYVGICGPVVINVNPGTYNEQFIVPITTGASATNTITINGHNQATISFNATNTAYRYGIMLLGADRIKIDSMIIDGSAGTYGYGILLRTAADNNIISNNTINVSTTNTTSANHSAIVFSNSQTAATTSGNSGNNNIIRNNILTGGYYGICAFGNTTAGSQTTGNIISKNIVKDMYSYGIYCNGQKTFLVDSNDVSRPSRANSTTTAGVFLNTANVSSMVSRNMIHGMFDGQTTSTSTCYGVASADPATGAADANAFVNNLVYDIKGNGTIYGLYNTGGSYSNYYHNTVVLDNQSATAGITYGIYQTTVASGVDYRNNIIYLTRTGTGTKRAIYFATTTSTITSNNNVFYFAPTGGTASQFGQYGTTNYADLAGWKTANASAYDQSGLHINPSFALTTPGDYKPTEASINGIGANVGVTTDILGSPRSASPDPGAYEFSLAGLDAGIAWVSPTMPVTAGLKTITVAVSNTQTVAINSLDLAYTDGVNILSQTFSGLNIGAGGSQQFSFTTQYNLTETSNLRAYIKVVNGQLDSSPLNDTTSNQLLCVPMSGNFTINNNGIQGNRNFLSFNSAVTALMCSGVTGAVNIIAEPGSGPYTEQVTIPAIAGASATNTITFYGNDVQLKATPLTANRHLIKLDGADYIILKKLKLLSEPIDFGWGVHLINGADHNIIDSCIIDISSVTSTTQSNSAGIVAAGSTTVVTTAGSASFNTISNNEIKGAYQGIIMNGAAGALNSTQNIIRNNNIHDFYANGIELTNNNGTIVLSNDIHRDSRTAVTTFAGVEMGTGNLSCVVNSNRIHDTHNTATTQTGTAYGIYLNADDATTGKENKVINNLVYNFNSNSGTQYGIYNSGSDSSQIYHNTIILDNSSSPSGTTRGIYQATLATGVDIRNNTIYITRGGTGTKHALYYGTTTSSIISNKNLLFINTPSATTAGIGSFGTVNYATLSDWRTANGNAYDQQSIETDPLFTNPGGAEYKPSAPSANNIGDNVGVTFDITGAARGTNPDPGAWEFALAGCSGSPTAGLVITSENPVCANTPLTLDLTGNTTGEGITYQWQISDDSTNWNNLGGVQTTSLYTTQQSVQKFYRAGVSCTGSPYVYTPGVLVKTPAPVSGTFTVKSGVATGGNNFQTLKEAINHIRCNINGPVVIDVEAGTVTNEQIIIPDIAGTSPVNTITINGNGSTISFISTNSAERAGIKLNGTDYVTIDNFVISANGSAATEYGYGIQLLNGADHNVIKNCTINATTTPATAGSTAFAGIVINSLGATTPTGTGNSMCDSNLVINNNTNGGYAGITVVANGTTNTISGNKVMNNRIVDQYIYGIYLNGNLNAVVDSNNISRPSRTSVSTFYGVYLSTGNINTKVSRNRIHDPFGGNTALTTAAYGTYVSADATAGNENVFSNNMVYDFKSAGTQYGMYNTGSAYTHYLNNSILLDGPAGDATQETYGFYQVTAVAGLSYKNNIVQISRPNLGANYCIYFSTAAAIYTGDYNDYFMAATTGTINSLGYYNGAQRTMLADWQTATSQDAHSLSVDPGFTSSSDLHLLGSSPLDDKGIPLTTVTDDIDGDLRDPSKPDIGADELPLSNGTDVKASLLISPSATNGCYGVESVVIRIKNNSTSPIDFTNKPVTVTANVSGATTASLIGTLSTGSLASGASQDVLLTGTVDMSAAGTYYFDATTTLSGDVNNSNNAMAQVSRTTVALAAGTISATPQNFCMTGGIPTLSAVNVTGNSVLQWQQSSTSGTGFTNINGANSNPYTLTTPISETTYYQLVASCGVKSETSAEIVVALNNPTVTNVSPGSRCGAGTVTIGASTTPGGSIKWYAASSGGTAIATGNTYTTPSINTTTTYYATAVTAGGGNQTVGPLSPASVGASTGSALTHYLIFTITAPVTITAVDVFPTVSGTAATIEVTNEAGNTVLGTASYTTNTTSAAQTVPMNITLQPGNYRMRQGTAVSLQRNTAGAVHPYTNGPVSITGNSFQADYYYYFYNWKFTQGCEGARVPVVAYISTAANQVWTGAVDDSWENAGNWSCNVVPDQNTDVTIPAGKTVKLNSNATVRSLNVQEGANFNIKSGMNLIINH